MIKTEVSDKQGRSYTSNDEYRCRTEQLEAEKPWICILCVTIFLILSLCRVFILRRLFIAMTSANSSDSSSKILFKPQHWNETLQWIWRCKWCPVSRYTDRTVTVNIRGNNTVHHASLSWRDAGLLWASACTELNYSSTGQCVLSVVRSYNIMHNTCKYPWAFSFITVKLIWIGKCVCVPVRGF